MHLIRACSRRIWSRLGASSAQALAFVGCLVSPVHIAFAQGPQASLPHGAEQHLWLRPPDVAWPSLLQSALPSPNAPMPCSQTGLWIEVHNHPSRPLHAGERDAAPLARYHDALRTLQFGVTVSHQRHLSFEFVAESGVSLRHWRAAQSHLPDEGYTTAEADNPAWQQRGWKKAPYLRAGASARLRPFAQSALVLSVSPYAATTLTRDVAVGATVDVLVPVSWLSGP